ncbi:MAG TPA: hypothetical protein DCP98_03800 [Sphaerochaeta sp.]|nr:hypothetical protein [Sphaerochaeta sp.]
MQFLQKVLKETSFKHIKMRFSHLANFFHNKQKGAEINRPPEIWEMLLVSISIIHAWRES